MDEVLMRKKTSNFKRYNLVIPEDLFAEVQKLADSRGVSVVDIFRQFTKLGLLAYKVADHGGNVIIRENQAEQRIVFL